MDALAERFIDFVYTPWAPVLLFIHAALESFFMPGAHDFFLVAVDVARPEWCFVFAVFSTAGSVVGGSCGYAAGRFGGRPILEKFFHSKVVDTVEEYFEKYGAWAIAIGGFTPLPYKIIAVASGIFEINYMKFFVVSLAARAARFFTVSGVLFFFGPRIKEYIISYLNTFSIFLIVMLIAVIFVYKVIVGRYRHE